MPFLIITLMSLGLFTTHVIAGGLRRFETKAGACTRYARLSANRALLPSQLSEMNEKSLETFADFGSALSSGFHSSSIHFDELSLLSSEKISDKKKQVLLGRIRGIEEWEIGEGWKAQFTEERKTYASIFRGKKEIEEFLNSYRALQKMKYSPVEGCLMSVFVNQGFAMFSGGLAAFLASQAHLPHSVSTLCVATPEALIALRQLSRMTLDNSKFLKTVANSMNESPRVNNWAYFSTNSFIDPRKSQMMHFHQSGDLNELLDQLPSMERFYDLSDPLFVRKFLDKSSDSKIHEILVDILFQTNVNGEPELHLVLRTHGPRVSRTQSARASGANPAIETAPPSPAQ